MAVLKTFSFNRWLEGEDDPYEHPDMLKAINKLESLFKDISDEQLKKVSDLMISIREIHRNNKFDDLLKTEKKFESMATCGFEDKSFSPTLKEVVELSMTFSDDDHADLIRVVAREKFQRADAKRQAEILAKFD